MEKESAAGEKTCKQTEQFYQLARNSSGWLLLNRKTLEIKVSRI